MTWAIWQPVTNANDESDGRPSSSSTHLPATASSADVAGVGSASPVFWSHAETSQSTASDAGTAPPTTKPNHRPEPIATRPGSAAARELLDDRRAGLPGRSGTGRSSSSCISR